MRNLNLLRGLVKGACLSLLSAMLAGCSLLDATLRHAGDWLPAVVTNTPAATIPPPPAWDEATLSSNWRNGAKDRMMNILSPRFSDAKVAEYLSWQRSRGANTVHLILCNNADGEGGGYGIYGNGISWRVDKSWVRLADRRIGQARAMGFAVTLWGATDDDKGWNRELLANPEQYMRDLSEAGLLRHASVFVLGLEVTEWGVSGAQIARYAAAARAVFGGRIGIHHNSDRADFARHADILFWQTEPGKSAAQIRASTLKALGYGKPVWFFELSRDPAPDLCGAAMEAGARGCGNI